MNAQTPTARARLIVWPLVTIIFASSSLFPVVAQDSIDIDYSDALPRIAPSEPNDALSSFEFNEKLKIETIAAEPMVIDPVAIAFDEFGRAFVVEMRGYSERGTERLGRIRLLEDTDHDGQFDRSTVFADRFESPTAVVCVRGGILVGDAPDIWFLKDIDNDQRADIRQIAYTGFGNSNIQQLLNNFQWGIDNRIYGTTGGNGGHIKPVDLTHLRIGNRSLSEPAPNPELDGTDFRGQDFAISVDSFQMSPLTGGGQFGMTFDRWGNRYVCSNSDHCQQIVLDPEDVCSNPLVHLGKTKISIATDGPAAEVFRISPVEPWRRVRTRLRVQGLVKGPIEGGGRAAGYFTSATGITVYNGDALPDEYTGNLFIGDVGSNLVHRKKIEDTGIAKKAIRVEQNTEFLRSADNWFRPVQMANAPDGSLVILDMYRENVEHPASLPELIKKHLDLNSGNDRGRILRMVPHEFVQNPRLLPGDANLNQLVQMLDHANGWHRQTAARLLAEGSWNELPQLLTDQGVVSDNPETRIRSMYLLAIHRRLDATQLHSLLQDPHPYVRIHALKNYTPPLGNDRVQRQILSMVNDIDLRVRFHVALTLGKLDSDIVDSFGRLAIQDGENRWMQIALAASAHRQRSQILKWLMVALRSPHDSQDPVHVRPILLELTRQMGLDHSDNDLEIAIQSLLDLLPADVSLAGEMLLQLMISSKATVSRIDRLMQVRHNTSLQTLTDRVTGSAQNQATDSRETVGHRVKAIGILRMARSEAFESTLSGLLDPRRAPEIRHEAIKTASHFSDPGIADVILDNVRSMGPDLRRQSILTLLSREGWTRQLLERISTGRLNPVFLDASARQRLTQHRVPSIRKSATKLLGRPIDSDRAKVLENYRTQIEELVGDERRGRTVFRKSCSACHRLENEGTEMGPSLAAYANRGSEAILTHVLDPNREVDPRYLVYSVFLEDGRALQGILSSQNATSIVLQDNEGNLLPITRTEIEELQSSTLSLMPDNLEVEVDAQEMADLIAYVLSQGG